MSGGSLGLRSGSYGSLQQYQQQQQQQQQQSSLPSVLCSASPALLPPSGRKASKMLLAGGRDKERRASWILKAAPRRKFGMLLLLGVSAAVLLSFAFFLVKDEDVSAGPPNLDSSNSLRKFALNSPLVPVESSRNLMNSGTEEILAIHHNETHPSLQINPPSILTGSHACENFAFPPPPPPDRKRTGPRPCPVCYVPVEHAMSLMPVSPSSSPILRDLQYVHEESSVFVESNGGSKFGGQPSLQQRNESYILKESMTVHCGFVKGMKPGQGTEFDISDISLREMEQCRGVVVASAIFGDYDILQQPKNISEESKKNVCFFMFVDKQTEASIKYLTTIDNTDNLWKVVVVENLPYIDPRRNGKIPKLLLHRLFPNARYSLWIDGKLELLVDPYQILERFLWRENETFAISRHYKRFDVFEEAQANKNAGKINNASIDQQIGFYKKEGLTPYTRAKLPISSDVPEGCVIIREHTPITNLFTCLWFNEVDRFTARDQLSFSTVRDKLRSKAKWRPHMFLDCERRNFVSQSYHRDLLQKRRRPPAPVVSIDESLPKNEVRDEGPRTPPLSRKLGVKRGKDKKPGSKRRRPRNGYRDTTS